MKKVKKIIISWITAIIVTIFSCTGLSLINRQAEIVLQEIAVNQVDDNSDAYVSLLNNQKLFNYADYAIYAIIIIVFIIAVYNTVKYIYKRCK